MGEERVECSLAHLDFGILFSEIEEGFLSGGHWGIKASNMNRIRHFCTILRAPGLQEVNSRQWRRIICGATEFLFRGPFKGEV